MPKPFGPWGAFYDSWCAETASDGGKVIQVDLYFTKLIRRTNQNVNYIIFERARVVQPAGSDSRHLYDMLFLASPENRSRSSCLAIAGGT